MENYNQETKHFKDHQEFIVAEFTYIAQTAFQAHEDRARVSEFFLISFGTFIAALFSSQVTTIDAQTLYILFSLLFLLVAFLGILTVTELTRLRLAWLESVLSMNTMKNFLLERSPPLRDCFKWRIDTIPSALKLNSIGFLKALEVSTLSGIAVGAAVAFISLALGNTQVNWWISIIMALVCAALILVLFYYVPLHNADKVPLDPKPVNREREANSQDENVS